MYKRQEESGSPSLVPFLEANRAELSCDLALICDTGLFESATPAITTMLRGLAKAEFTLHAASRDLHSGMYGGLARNPLHVLTKILSGLHDDQGRVQVPGFYDDVTELPDALRAQWQNLAFDHAGYLGDVGLSVPAGEADRTPLEMIWSRPTAEVNGMWGGYTGAGFKTVLPSEAHAKVSFRLVSRQDPENGVTTYGYNARGQLTSASLDGQSATYRYNNHGDMVDTLWHNGLHEVETFSPLGETLTRTTSFPGLGNLETETNSLDALGRKINWALTVPGGTRTSTYTYDPLGQLTRSVLAVTGQTNQTSTYGYDGNTNRTRFNNANSNFNDADRNTALSYSPAGAVSQDAGNASYTYDWRDQLKTYRKGADNATYAYDGNNLRLQKTFNGTTTQYLWDGSQVLKEYAGDGSVKAAYFLGADRGAIKTGGQWYQYIKDSRGSITGMIDQTGNRIATYRASDYGAPSLDQGSVYNPFRWNAEQLAVSYTHLTLPTSDLV